MDLSLMRQKAQEAKRAREAGELPPKPERTDVPLKQIRKFCLECVGWSAPEVAAYTGVKCPLWEMRFGKPVASSQRKHPDLMDREKVLARHKAGK